MSDGQSVHELVRFNDPSVWLQGPTRDEAHQLKFRTIVGMVPPDVQTILDVGCGDGELTNRLPAAAPLVIALDRVPAPLRFVKVPRVVGTIGRLPFGDRSFDLVCCSEVLEHLPDGLYQSGLQELGRVARSWLLLGVPFHEYLPVQRARCAQCGGVFHTSGHVRSFASWNVLAGRFPGWRLRSVLLAGSCQIPPCRWLFRARHRLEGMPSNDSRARCPACGGSPAPGRPPRRASPARLLRRLEQFLSPTEQPQWMVCLLQRRTDPRQT